MPSKLGLTIIFIGIFLCLSSGLMVITLPSEAYAEEYKEFNVVGNAIATSIGVFFLGIGYLFIGFLYCRK